MITLGTGKLSAKEEKGLGLAGEHDYAVLDMKEVRHRKMFLVKNPWCDGIVWKGSVATPSSASENLSTDDLREALPSTDPTTPGTFWIDFDNVLQNFESLYLNWNPGLFRHRQDHHFTWTLPEHPRPGSFAQNPQYSIKSTNGGPVWVLLCRHFTTAEHTVLKKSTNSLSSPGSSLGFISIYVFDAAGHRVYLTDDVFHRGPYVDSPQTLVRLDVAPNTKYTVVPAYQDLPLPKYSFTLSTFSTTPLDIVPANDRFSHQATYTGAWTHKTAGGNANCPSYPSNPQFSIQLPATSSLLLFLEADQTELAVHVELVWAGGKRVTAVTSRDLVGGSGEYRRGCALVESKDVAMGTYTIVCSTFEAGQLGKFSLRVASMVKCHVRPVPAEGAGRLSLHVPAGVFGQGIDRILAPVVCTRLTRVLAIVRHTEAMLAMSKGKAKPALRVSFERGQGPNKVVLTCSASGQFSDAPMGVRSGDVDMSPDVAIHGGFWLVIERAEGRSLVDTVDVEILSDSSLDIGAWGVGDG
jgi:calpain-7